MCCWSIQTKKSPEFWTFRCGIATGCTCSVHAKLRQFSPVIRKGTQANTELALLLRPSNFIGEPHISIALQRHKRATFPCSWALSIGNDCCRLRAGNKSAVAAQRRCAFCSTRKVMAHSQAVLNHHDWLAIRLPEAVEVCPASESGVQRHTASVHSALRWFSIAHDRPIRRIVL